MFNKTDAKERPQIEEGATCEQDEVPEEQFNFNFFYMR